jgi:predicted AAA+ superfamily ATPase
MLGVSFLVSTNGDKAEAFKNSLAATMKQHPEGLTIADLSRILKSHRQTVTKYVLWLEGADVIYRRRIGAVTLHYMKKDWERLEK